MIFGILRSGTVPVVQVSNLSQLGRVLFAASV